MNKRLELAIQDLALAVINGNTERAERLITQIPREAIVKVAYGSAALFELATKYLPEGEGKEIARNIEEKKAAKAGA
jgi:hypothetical protein